MQSVSSVSDRAIERTKVRLRSLVENVIPLATAALLGTLVFTPLTAFATANETVDVLHVGQVLPRFNLLTATARLYLRYKVIGDKRETIDIWSRETSYETRNGQRLLHITQRWDGVVDKPYSLKQDAWFEAGTFRPITQVKELTRDGKTQVAGYRFLPDKIIGMAELANNSRKDFDASSPEPSYNFETDMELLQTLPLAEGYEASIVFYDAGPGADAPKRYRYKVLGSDTIVGPDGHPIDCWVVATNDGGSGPVVQWWYAKQTQVMIREEARLTDGSLLVKTLLNSEAT